MPTKEQIAEAIYDVRAQRGSVPKLPGRVGDRNRRDWVGYGITVIGRHIIALKKEHGADWGPAGNTGPVFRDYTPGQTKKILASMADDLARTTSASHYKDAGFRPSDFVLAWERLVNQEAKKK